MSGNTSKLVSRPLTLFDMVILTTLYSGLVPKKDLSRVFGSLKNVAAFIIVFYYITAFLFSVHKIPVWCGFFLVPDHYISTIESSQNDHGE